MRSRGAALVGGQDVRKPEMSCTAASNRNQLRLPA